MKLQADRMEGQNAIARHSAEGVVVNNVEYRESILVPWRGDLVPWPVGEFAQLDESRFAAVAALAPELVIFGSGARIRFPKPAWLQPLIARRIGIETMDTAAACRTYNILAQEGREVAVALLLDQSA